MGEALLLFDGAVWLGLLLVHDGDGVHLRPVEALGGGGREEEGVAEGDVGLAELGAGVGVVLSRSVVTFGEGALEEGQAASLVELGTGVVGALEELLLEVGPVFVVTEKGFEVFNGAKFRAVSGGGVTLGFEGGVEVVVEGAEDGVVVGGAVVGDAVFEEWLLGCWAGGVVDCLDSLEES